MSTEEQMVLVFAPMGNPVSVGRDGQFSRPTQINWEVVGMLRSKVSQIDGIERLKGEFQHNGCEVDFIARQTSDTPGYIGFFIAYRVLAPNIKVAYDIPGFIPLYDYMGETYDLLRLLCNKKPVRSVGQITEHLMSGSVHTPKFEGAESICLSLVPTGEIGRCVFLKNRPEHWYEISGSMSDEDAVEAIRKFLVFAP